MYKNSKHKELRNGLTTGTCAAAVAKASVYMLISQEIIEHVSVTLPAGKEVILELENCKLTQNKAQCSTIKDAGDDPDITNGAEIVAHATFNETNKATIIGGKGIGTVTKPGLAVKVGKPAINPVPLKMIKDSIAAVLPKNKGVEVVISIPEGQELAKKTFNPRLGIEGGLSVLGTTGIVKPMSEEALKASMVVELKHRASGGNQQIIFTPGNYSTSFSKENLNINENKVVLTSNYIGFMLEEAVKCHIKKIVLIGHLGKLVKIAGGVFQTHSRVADARNEILASHYMMYSEDISAFKKIMHSNTTEEAIDFIRDKAFWDYFATRIKTRAEKYIHQELGIEVILLSQKAGILSATTGAFNLIKSMNDEK
ncbi:cobalt-precorrin-5B (C(1))-methyltransferase CbiD [Plebeiibacterium marinum]|uniref:Cobalt-precorrin-5B C(1)-methyltransferase n=1 Tax=Plebeiibacterium marinum TaxID=2992111 RepID=A0AAE3MG90_9BACT|nr:cobalt-precorrin-5B (C(1))-methyltransferase CbiD [Plebeiobacterium marinum]MCW3807176.1 cobalt-precorrin-5B (C(1))-methyltransferase CbiD [Plebeiobacterium marinum]